MTPFMIRPDSPWPHRPTTRTVIRLLIALLLVVAAVGPSVSAQAPKTTSRMLYHNGPIMEGTSTLYVIWYGCWAAECGGYANPDHVVRPVIDELLSSLGGSPYFLINAGYPDARGVAPSGGLLYAGFAGDLYSHGPTLTKEDLGDIVKAQIASRALPLDTAGIYLVLTSADVTVVDGQTQFCVSCCQLHGTTRFDGDLVKYGFVGNPRRCPSSCARQFAGDSTPNGNLAADAMANWVAHTLNETVTNPLHPYGWFDRYGLENADKCEGVFGDTYPVEWNGSVANVRLGGRDYLLHQNWVNDRRGRCALRPF
jgi:Phosphate-induced protein 1 conserved region